VTPGTDVQGDQQRAQRRIGERELDRSAVARHHAVDVDRDHRDREHGRRLGEAKDQVIGVETVGVQRELNPRPHDNQNQARKAGEDAGRWVVCERSGELAERSGEHEVEEQLEPGRMPFLSRIARRAQARRVESKGAAGAQISGSRRRLLITGGPVWSAQAGYRSISWSAIASRSSPM
jgi:hypothetical protein